MKNLPCAYILVFFQLENVLPIYKPVLNSLFHQNSKWKIEFYDLNSINTQLKVLTIQDGLGFELDPYFNTHIYNEAVVCRASCFVETSMMHWGFAQNLPCTKQAVMNCYRFVDNCLIVRTDNVTDGFQGIRFMSVLTEIWFWKIEFYSFLCLGPPRLSIRIYCRIHENCCEK